jgi:hypothetical protein
MDKFEDMNKVDPKDFQSKEEFVEGNTIKKTDKQVDCRLHRKDTILLPGKNDRGLRLHYTDFKLISEILESIDMSRQEKHLLWKVKTIIHNMDMAKLRKES